MRANRPAALAAFAVLAVATQRMPSAEAGPGSARVAILRSGDLPAYRAPADAFRTQLAQSIPSVQIEEHDMGGDRTRGEAILRQLRARGVDLVFAVGAKAAYLAARSKPALPVIFTSVLDWRSYRRALGAPHVAGVALEVPADAQLTQLRFLTPALRRVVVVTRSKSHTNAVLDDLIAAGRMLQIEIVPLPLARLGELERFANRDQISTVVYPLAHPAIYTSDNFLRLVALSRRHRLPLIAFSKEFVEVGAVMAVDINYGDLGAQAALQAQQILQDATPPAELGVAVPVGTYLVVNEAATQAIGMAPPDALMRLANLSYSTVIELSPDFLEASFDAGKYADEPDQRGERDPWRDEISEMEFFAVKEAIVSVASRRAQQLSTAPSIVSVLTNEELRLLGATNLAEALQYLPGFTHRYKQDGHYDILFRGQKEPADILILIDGERLNNMYDGAAIYDLPIENIERIEVIRGPGSALYGTNAFAGVISIETYDAEDESALSAWGTSYLGSSGPHEANTFAGRAHARGSLSLGAWKLGATGTVVTSEGARMDMPMDLTGYFAAGEPHYLNDEKLKLDASLSVMRRGLLRQGDRLHLHPKLFFHTQGPNFGPAETWAPNATYHRDVLMVPVDYSTPLGRRIELRTRLSFTRQAIDNDLQIRPDGFTSRANPLAAPEGLRKRTDYTIHTVSLEPQVMVTLPKLAWLWAENVLTVGALAEYGYMLHFDYDQNYLERFGSLIYYENFSDTIEQSLEDAGLTTEGFENYNDLALEQEEADRVVFSAYAESHAQIPRTHLGLAWVTAGLRLDRFSDYRAPSEGETEPGRKDYLTVNPRLALVWNPEFWCALDGLTIKALHGWAFRAPSFSELYDSTEKITDSSYRIPNEALEPQTAKVTEVGVELRPIAMIGNWTTPHGPSRSYQRYASAVTTRFNYFHMRTDDLLATDPLFNPAGYQIINFPGQDVDGFETELHVRATPLDFAFANFSYVRAEQSGECVRTQADGNCPNDRHFISTDIREIPRRRVNVGANFRPVGLPMDLLGSRAGKMYRWLSPLSMSLAYHHVSESANNARVTFEQLRFPFKHPGYDYVDLGLGYRFRMWGKNLSVRAFVYNLLDDTVFEPIIIQLDPRPEQGYFLPRPGRRLSLGLVWSN